MNREKFKAARLALGMTQKELAEELGLCTQTISNIECGQRGTSEYTIGQLRELLHFRHISLKSARRLK